MKHKNTAQNQTFIRRSLCLLHTICAGCKKCDMWVRLCALKDEYFRSIKNVKKDTYICSLHFIGESRPTEKFPDPVISKSQAQNFKL